MSRIYISGPITGNPEFQTQFERAFLYLTGKGYTPVNPAMSMHLLPADATYEEYMNIDLELLGMCNAIYMLNGWEKSKGACIELGYAMGTDKFIFYEQEGTI